MASEKQVRSNFSSSILGEGRREEGTSEPQCPSRSVLATLPSTPTPVHGKK
jgi:hypothetical protein